MKHRIVVLCVLVASFAATARAQAPGSFAIKCNPATVSYQFSPTEEISSFVCTTDAMINGVAFNGLTFSQANETVGGESKDWGVIVGSLVNGSLVFFQYQAVAARTGAATGVATMSYKIVGGTGTAIGISGSGTCKAAGGVETVQACVGAYVIR